MVGKGAVPLVLLLLGMQLAKIPMAQGMRIVGLAAFIRLAVAPAIALLPADWLNLAGSTLQACVVEASMPTAVTTTVLAIEFDVKPEFVTSVVLLSNPGQPHHSHTHHRFGKLTSGASLWLPSPDCQIGSTEPSA